MKFNLAEIRAFVAVVRCRTFTAASVHLKITQPALSRRIQLLEYGLGGPLFERFPEGPKLTDAGREFLPYAEEALMALEDGTEAVNDTVRGRRGRISLALIGALCNDNIVRGLRDLHREIPGTQLSLSFHAGTSDEVSELVLQGEATWGLRYRVDPRLDSEVIGNETILVVCSPGHRLANAEVVTAASLADETWITFPLRHADPVPEFWARLSFYGLAGRRSMLIDSTEAQKRLIKADFGVGLIPEGSVREELRNGQLVALNVAQMRASVPVALVRRKGAFLSAAARKFADRLATSIYPPAGATEAARLGSQGKAASTSVSAVSPAA